MLKMDEKDLVFSITEAGLQIQFNEMARIITSQSAFQLATVHT